MGMVEEREEQQQQTSIVLKHYCKVCKRGFGCAGALGGHMRTHGAGDVRFQSCEDDDNGISNFRSRPEGGKHSYFLRTNTNRFTSYRASEDSDKRSLTMPGNSSSESEGEGMMIMKSGRRKISENYEDGHRYSASSEEEDLANCLVMLSNKSCVLSDNKEENKAKEVEKGMFQCKACKKVFGSHQALGGHRASHKKVKGCYAARITNLNEDDKIEEDFINSEEYLMPSDSSEPRLDLDHPSQFSTTRISSKRKSKEHQCSICHRVFSSGQALGGHKRCHWLTSNMPADSTIIQSLHDQFQFDSPQFFKKPMLRKSEPLDLNFPPLFNNAAEAHVNSATPLDYEAPARIFQQLSGKIEEVDNNSKNNHHHQQQQQRMHGSLHDLNSEEACRIKLAKLSDLKDMNLDGGSSQWLQVGIASTTDITATP